MCLCMCIFFLHVCTVANNIEPFLFLHFFSFWYVLYCNIYFLSFVHLQHGRHRVSNSGWSRSRRTLWQTKSQIWRVSDIRVSIKIKSRLYCSLYIKIQYTHVSKDTLNLNCFDMNYIIMLVKIDKLQCKTNFFHWDYVDIQFEINGTFSILAMNAMQIII